MPAMKDEYIKASMKKFLKSNLPETPIILTDGDPDNKEWIRVRFGGSDPGVASDTIFTLYCCTTDDSEYFKLANLVDRVRSFIEEDSYIPYLEPIPDDPYWKSKASMRINFITESNDLTGENDVKIRIIDIRATRIS